MVAAFSGGKDSTAMVLRLHELGEDFNCLFTPTGNELPGLRAHIDAIVAVVGKRLIEPLGPSLDDLIQKFTALPNNRQRWCTRMIKIQPCAAYLKANPGQTLLVGLRADEEERQGLYGDFATYRYPLREWGWGLQEVRDYLRAQGVKIPERSDCALCPFQRLGEWFALWREHPEEYAQGEAYEAQTGHTFRSPSRDAWPARLADLRAEFERGRRPPGLQLELTDGACRVCSI